MVAICSNEQEGGADDKGSEFEMFEGGGVLVEVDEEGSVCFSVNCLF